MKQFNNYRVRGRFNAVPVGMLHGLRDVTLCKGRDSPLTVTGSGRKEEAGGCAPMADRGGKGPCCVCATPQA